MSGERIDMERNRNEYIETSVTDSIFIKKIQAQLESEQLHCSVLIVYINYA